MIKEISKVKLFLYGLTILTALIILVDFTLPGKVFTEDIISIDKERQQYYNAAGNSHYSYKLITSKHRFTVSEDFAKSVEDEKIKYSVSLIFNEVNRYDVHSSEQSNIHSFRIASGLILPLIIIFTILIAYKYKKKMNTLLFVLHVVLLGNLIFLIL